MPPMSRAARVTRTGLWLLDRIADTIVLSLLTLMVLVVSWQVFTRYVLGFSPVWAPETALLLVGWVAFLGIAIGIRERSHIAVGYVVDRLPSAMRKVVERLGPVLMLLFGGYLIVQGWDFTTLMAQSTLPGTGLPRSVQYAAMPASGILIVLYATLQLLGVRTERAIGLEEAADVGDQQRRLG